MLIAITIFALMLGSICGAYWLFVLRPEDQEERALKRRLKTGRSRANDPQIVKTPEILSALGPLNTILSQRDAITQPLQLLIRKAGLNVTIGTVVLGSLFLASVTFALVTNVTSLVLVGVVAGVAAGLVPFGYLRYAAKKRLETFEQQFPEAIDLMARALRAGHALSTALQMVGDEVPDPVGAEFKLLFEQQNYGLSLPDALRGFAERMPILDARFFVTAILTQREMGGNLSEVLDNLASVIRERFKVKRQVRVVSAHGRITGIVLGFLPPAVAAVLFLISPEHIQLLINDPLGMNMVVVAIVLQCIGVLVIRRIVNVEY